MQPFDSLTIPLSGRQLIEASAGTGKTYSLALLFLRLILERDLEVEQILVVTFTNAATEELRGRIRARLRQALDLLEGSETGAEGDSLVQLLARLPDLGLARQRLADSLTRMDGAAIHTIHGFCQRMLQDQAFEAGAPFGVEFIDSEQSLRREIVEDFWRQRFYPAPAEVAEWAAATWQSPEKLLQVLQGFLARPEVFFVPAVNAEELGARRASAEEHWQRVWAGWRQDREVVAQILRTDASLSRNKSSGYGEEPLAAAIAAMDQLAAREAMAWLLPAGVELLAASVMAGKVKGKKSAPDHPFFQLVDAWYLSFTEFSRLARADTVAAAYRFLREQLDRQKREQGVLYFDDQLSRLAAALAGREGRALERRVRDRFRVALVDEFQDTDPLQYRIFQRLFGNAPEPGLFMIGDPKQSIYSFRGADIFAYIRARRETPSDAAHTMATNYRSTPAMVRAVNRLFAREAPFVFPEIEFYPVQAPAQVGDTQLLVAGETPAPLQVQLLPLALASSRGRIAKDQAAEVAAEWTAREINGLLQLGRGGQVTLGKRMLTGGDLAVLVRTHREAELVRRALNRLQIASVYYSQDSVMATEEADQLARLLAALLDLSDEALVAGALITDFFGLDAAMLHALRRDPLRWSEMVAELAEYHQRWLQTGVMAMLHQLLHRRQVVKRLLALPGGERRLTNFLHLAELLQAEAGHLRLDELLRWFNQQRHAPEPDSASQQLRLESDGQLVRIVTIHKAKGLEYPVVFLPFLWRVRQVRPNEVFSFHGPDGRLCVDLGSGEEKNYQRAERERLAEDLRLLYVAMTRARCCCYFAWGLVSGLEQSGLAWLLHRDGEGSGVAADLSDERIRADLAAVDHGEGLMHFPPCPSAEGAGAQGEITRQDLPGPREFTGRIDSSWTVASYSRLVAGAVQAPAEVAGAEGATPVRDNSPSALTFPRGAAAGTFLHAVLELLDFQDVAATGAEWVASLLRQQGLGAHWAPLVLEWLAQVAATPLRAGEALRLCQLPREDRLAELGFHFALDSLEQAAMNGVLGKYGIPPVAMQPARLHGLMKGYVDLVFRYQGRFYLADYKSNYLGPAVGDYQQENLQQAMTEHRYDLQYLIYCVALHRYLGRRLQDYNYGRHFGGVFYLFLRGMHPDHPGCGVWHALPPSALIEALDRCCGQGGAP